MGNCLAEEKEEKIKERTLSDIRRDIDRHQYNAIELVGRRNNIGYDTVKGDFLLEVLKENIRMLRIEEEQCMRKCIIEALPIPQTTRQACQCKQASD